MRSWGWHVARRSRRGVPPSYAPAMETSQRYARPPGSTQSRLSLEPNVPPGTRPGTLVFGKQRFVACDGWPAGRLLREREGVSEMTKPSTVSGPGTAAPDALPAPHSGPVLLGGDLPVHRRRPPAARATGAGSWRGPRGRRGA